jgi:hypothetical protein
LQPRALALLIADLPSMLVRFNIKTILVDMDFARRAAAVRARTRLKLPDAYWLWPQRFMPRSANALMCASRRSMKR